MTLNFRISRPAIAMSVALLLGTSSLALAETVFDAPAAFTGNVMFSGPDRAPVYAGTEVTVSGRGFAPNQSVELQRGNTKLTDAPVTADDKGEFSFNFALPADAALGLQPVVVLTDAPDSAGVVDLKVSPKIDAFGQDKFAIESAKLVRGLYQVDASAKNGTLFVTSAVGRPPVKESKLLKLDGATLQVIAEVTPEAAPAQGDREGGLFAVYGVGVDDKHDTVWTTNTRQNTISVYKQSDLSLVKQFEPGAVAHSRDVVVDTDRDRAYSSAVGPGEIAVFDTTTLEQLESFRIESAIRGGEFVAMSLAFDRANGKLYTVSLESPEAARIDVATGQVDVISVPGITSGTGIDVDPATGTVFVVAQGSDNLVALDAAGNVLYTTSVGAGPLNVTYDAKTDQVFVANRGSNSIAVVNAKTGALDASLDAGSFTNDVVVLADGTVLAVNKSRGEDDATADQIWRIAPKQ